MSVTKADFEAKAASIKTLKSSPSDSEQLSLYGLYKQAIVGDINTGKTNQLINYTNPNPERPGMMDQRGRSKWDAWNAKKGRSVVLVIIYLSEFRHIEF